MTKEYIMISDKFAQFTYYGSETANYSNEVYWGYGDGGEGETIATFTNARLSDIYLWLENWMNKNGYQDIEIHNE